MDDEYLLGLGYKEYEPTKFDNDSIITRFQKRFDDDFGKKYFINVVKWSNYYVPESRRDKWWKAYSYEYEVQVEMRDENPLNLCFFSSWTIEKVEEFMETFFEKMKPNYYESWDERRGVRP